MHSAILTYHSIDTSDSVISTSPAVFESHMNLLSVMGVRVVPLSRVQNTNGCVAITFDDGFENFEEHALPCLVRHGFPATVFLVSGYCGGHNNWPSQPPRVPRLPLLSWTAVQRLTGPALEWGAHTVSHPNLTQLSEAAAEHEIRGCRDAIEQHTGARVTSFSYPYGAVNAAARSAIQREFRLACGTRLDFLRGRDRTFELPRIDSYYLRNPVWMKQLLRPGGRAYIGIRRAMRETRQWLSR